MSRSHHIEELGIRTTHNERSRGDVQYALKLIAIVFCNAAVMHPAVTVWQEEQTGVSILHGIGHTSGSYVSQALGECKAIGNEDMILRS